MGEPTILTKKDYFRFWEKYCPLSKPFKDVQEVLTIFIFIFGVSGILAAEVYGMELSESGPELMIILFVAFAICVALNLIAELRKRHHFALWEQDYPYELGKTFTEEDFRQADQ